MTTPAAAPAPAAAAPAAVAPAAAPAPAAAAAPAAVAPAAAAPVAAPAAPDAVAVAAAETAFAQAISAAQGKPADSAEAKAVATARDALKALQPTPAAVKKAPGEYADFAAPQGVILDKTVATEVKAVAKELDLTQAEAQKLIDRVGPIMVKSQGTALTAYVTRRADEWRAAALADTELGGTPEKFDQNRALAMKTFDAFGTPALKDVLNKTGLGDNPEVLRWAMRIGKQIGPDNKIVSGTTFESGQVRPEDKLWPDKK